VRYQFPLNDEEEAFRDEVRTFLGRNLPPNWGTPGYTPWAGEAEEAEFLRDWQYRLNRAHLVAIGWPEEYGGRGAGIVHQLIYSQEMAGHAAPPLINLGAINAGGPVIIHWGTEWQKTRFLPKMLSAEEVWCQTFSEPDAGSDLAALRTRAVPDGENFVVTGQKIWTTRAHIAEWSFLLARTDPDRPKHHGITYFLLDMRTPGVTIRPLRQINGRSDFNQVFLDGVRLSRELVVGEVNQGWRIATGLLNFERASFGDTTRLERRFEIVSKLAREITRDGAPRKHDPVTRDKMVRFAIILEALRGIGWRTLVAGLRGAPPGPESAVSKLLITETDQAMADFAMELLGPMGILMQESAHAVAGGDAPAAYLTLRAATIGGGTSEVQRNVLGQRLLGLPRDG
jgi:alkylation response protein AidB-like acyl-CoA dehydrogenase